MSKKDYEAMAKVINKFRADTDQPMHPHLDQCLIIPLALILRKENNQFDLARFLSACGAEA